MTGFRFVDRFERRCGESRIADRIAVAGWSRVDGAAGRWPVAATPGHGPRSATDPVWWLVPEPGLHRSDHQPDGPGPEEAAP